MSEAAGGDSPQARALTALVYLLHVLTLVFAFPLLIALAINLFARAMVRGTIYDAHFVWQLVTTQWALLAGVPGAILFTLGPRVHDSFVPLGSLLLLLASFWIIYRALRGFMFWSQRRPPPVRHRRESE